MIHVPAWRSVCVCVCVPVWLNRFRSHLWCVCTYCCAQVLDHSVYTGIEGTWKTLLNK